jgi:hypothetical protein
MPEDSAITPGARRHPTRWLALVLALAVGGIAPLRAAAENAGEAPAAADDAAPTEYEGPLGLQDVFLPLQLRPQSYPESAALLPAGGFSLRAVVDWTNHFAKTNLYTFDGESVTAQLRLRYAPWERVELGLDVPWTTRFDGTLDPFIESVESTLDARVQERFETPRFEWNALVLAPDGSRRLRMKDGDGLGDVSLRGKLALARAAEHGFDAALVATLGVPTGGNTFGGEGLTPGLGLHAQRPFDTVSLFAGATLQHHTDATSQDFRLAPWRWMGYAGAEWRPWKGWLGLVVEYQVYGKPARTNSPLTHAAHYYAGGLRFYLPWNTTFEATVIENLGLIENRNSSDVVFQFALGWKLEP